MRQSALLVMFNEAVPFAYVGVKLTVAGILFHAYGKQKKYRQTLEEFESLPPYSGSN